METVKIDLGCLLEELKALDLSSAKTEVLIEYETCLEFLKSAVQQQFAAIPDYALDVIQQCLDFEAKIRQEFSRRGFEFTNLWDELQKNPEILLVALRTMLLLSLVDAYEGLQKSIDDEPDLEPLYELVEGILQERLAGCPTC